MTNAGQRGQPTCIQLTSHPTSVEESACTIVTRRRRCENYIAANHSFATAHASPTPRGYADRGGTVLLSSHLLHDIEVIADDLVVIGNGRIVAQGTKADLLATAGTVARAADAVALASAVERGGHTVTVHADNSIHTDATTDQVGQAALAAGVALTELRGADGAGLEDMFLELTADTQREGVAA